MSVDTGNTKRRWAFEHWWRPRVELAQGEQAARVPEAVRSRYRRQLRKALTLTLRRMVPILSLYLLLPIPLDFMLAEGNVRSLLLARITAVAGMILVSWPVLAKRSVKDATGMALAVCGLTAVGAAATTLLTGDYQGYLMALLPLAPAMLPLHRGAQMLTIATCGGLAITIVTWVNGAEALNFLPLLAVALLAAWLIGRTMGRLRARSFLRAEQLRREAMAAESLLKLILPEGAAHELLKKGRVEPTLHDEVTILFADLVGFSRVAEELDGVQLVQELDDIFTEFDRISHQFGVERIKTIGDAYMAVAGLDGSSDHAQRAVAAGEEMIAFLKRRPQTRPASPHWDVRVGAHSGPVVSGILGGSRLVFDIWGDAVNVAARMESTSEPGKINVSSRTNALLQEVERESRGRLAVKHKGDLTMFFVSPRSELPVLPESE